jgi:hypothetical protein
MIPLDHAELCLQKIRENTEANVACQALLGMIWYSACPPSCRARHDGGWAKNPSLEGCVPSINTASSRGL